MKILIMGFSKLKYMPYINFYLDNIDCENNNIHVLYWNRDCKSEDKSKYHSVIFHEFSSFQEDDVIKSKKICNFVKYREYAKSILINSNFDFIIVLHTITAIVVMDILIKHYNKKYILDYRDSTYEENFIFQKLIHVLVNHSKLTFISSDAFRKYLPANTQIYTSHNILLDSFKHRDEKIKYGTHSEKIRIGFWGFIRHEDINRQIIEKISKDSRFELHYYGREQNIAKSLKNYTEELQADNIFFHGEYRPEERYEFIRNIDIIHNIYYDNNMMLAMGNKYYDGIIFYLPQLCFTGSFMGRMAKKAAIGLECDPANHNFTNEINNYYTSISQEIFRINCDIEVNRVIDEYKKSVQLLNTALTEDSYE